MSENPRLNEIQARLDAATPGPWAVDELGDVETVPEFDLHRFDIMPDTIARTELRKEDGAFIAAAPVDVARLTRAVEAVLELADTWQQDFPYKADQLRSAIENALNP